jgi:hypothetical protein
MELLCDTNFPWEGDKGKVFFSFVEGGWVFGKSNLRLKRDQSTI